LGKQNKKLLSKRGNTKMSKAKQYAVIAIVAIAGLALLKRFAPNAAAKIGV
jgi:hypothetical protein